MADVLNNLANLYRSEGKLDQAEPLYRRALAIQEHLAGSDHPDLADLLYNLATVVSRQGRYDEAETLFKRALAMKEKTTGPDSPEVASTLNNLAIVYANQARYAEAEPLFARALAIKEQALGAEHPTLANSLIGLANVEVRQGRYAEAEPLLMRALAIKEKATGPDHPEVVTALLGLADLHLKQGQARPRRARLPPRPGRLREDRSGRGTATSRAASIPSARSSVRQGHPIEAESLHKRALALFEMSLGNEHPSVALSLEHLAETYQAEGFDAEADSLFKRALAIREKTPAPNRPATVDAARPLRGLPEQDRADDRGRGPGRACARPAGRRGRSGRRLPLRLLEATESAPR